MIFVLFLQLVTFRHAVGERGPWGRENRKTSYPFPSHLALVYHPLYANDFLLPRSRGALSENPQANVKDNNQQHKMFVIYLL